MASKTEETVSLLSLLVLLATTAFSGFTIVPEDVTVTISASTGNRSITTARFYCQPLVADDIFWLVNGTSLQNLPFLSGITSCSNALPNGTRQQRIYTLKVDARLEYNETTIVCVLSRATYVELSTVAELIFSVESDHAQSLYIPTGFAEAPMSLTLAMGERAIFICQHCTTNAIIWRLNGTKLRYSSLPQGITSSYVFPRVHSMSSLCGVIYLLTINDVIDYNKTMISCEADTTEQSDPALLLTQGQLDHVTDLVRNTSNPQADTVTYTWRAPYSLNLTNADPDIAYCVRVYNVTCPMGVAVDEVNDCNVTQPYLEIPKSFGGDATYEIEVIARSNLEVGLEHINDINSTKYQDKFVSFNHTLVSYNITVVTHKTAEVLVQLNLQGIEPSNVIPTEIEIHVIDAAVNDNSLESAISNDIIICPTTLLNDLITRTETGTIKHAIFNLNCPTPLRIKTLYLSSVHIPTPGCTINSSSSIELSTHLIQNIMVTSMPQSSAILVSGDILNVNISNITVLGFLAIVYANSTDSTPLHGIGTPSNNEQNANVSLISSPGQRYRASIFSIEHTGLPAKKSINKAQRAVETDQQLPGIMQHTARPNFEATIDRNGCVHCSFLDDNLRSCVIIASNKTQIMSSSGITSIDVFELERIIGTSMTANKCINRSTYDFNIIAFSFVEGMSSISGPGVAIIQSDSGQSLTTVILVISIIVTFSVIACIAGIIVLIKYQTANRHNKVTVTAKVPNNEPINIKQVSDQECMNSQQAKDREESKL